MNQETSIAWGTEKLWRDLQPLLPGIAVEVVARVSSTNTALLERARAAGSARVAGEGMAAREGADTAFGRRAADLQPCLLVAEHQTGGRGRHGRGWQSQRGTSLTFSLSVPIAPRDWSGLSLAAGVAVAEALDTSGGSPRIGLKWPNDLWLIDSPGHGRKLGGILIETVSAGSNRLAIVGVGINVLPLEPESIRDAGTGLACWQEIEPDASAPAALARIACPLVEAVLAFGTQGLAPFAERFAARDLLRDQRVRTTDPSCTEGVAEGISPSGELLVRTAAGLHRLSFGEVSVRPMETV
jgi:BirA family biotin operon repressor/biotin-[acetyl-CoA-carboxylase] ligase